MILLSSRDFFHNIFFKKSFRYTTRMSNGLDQDQDRHSFSPDLGPKLQTVCKGYQQTTKVASSKERVNEFPLLKQGSYRQVCVRFKDFSRTSKRF